MRRSPAFLTPLAAMLVLLLAANGLHAEGTPSVGSRAPDFTLKDVSGNDVKLSSLRGKVVVIDFWASWCKPCLKELPALDVLAMKYTAAEKDVVFLAINIDNEKENGEDVLKDLGIKHVTVLWDQQKEVPGLYQPPTMPTTFVVDKKGIIRHVNEGYKSGDEKRLKKQVDKLL
jgi:thiol-disulfide isomerase/thioredoxin